MKRFALALLVICSGLCHMAGDFFRLLYDLAAWETPVPGGLPPFILGADDPWERWADSEGRGPLASLERGGSGRLGKGSP